MQRFFMLLICIVTISGLRAQSPEVMEDLEFAIHIHDTASVYESEIQALNAFEKVCEEHPQSWRPFYWTAYMYTQVGRLIEMTKKEKDPKAYIDKAQEYFDRAAKLLPNKSAAEQSDFHALQHLIHLFQARYVDDEMKKDEIKKSGQESLNAAIRAEPDNPVVYVLVGTQLIGDARDDRNFGKVLAGQLLLQQAKEKFEAAPPKRSITLHWNQEWLPFWLPYAEKLLRGEASNG